MIRENFSWGFQIKSAKKHHDKRESRWCWTFFWTRFERQEPIENEIRLFSLWVVLFSKKSTLSPSFLTTFRVVFSTKRANVGNIARTKFKIRLQNGLKCIKISTLFNNYQLSPSFLTASATKKIRSSRFFSGVQSGSLLINLMALKSPKGQPKIPTANVQYVRF